jgi:NAD(P)-dependent dehydrogenase (short-subunit alcohol dehydrogenase family)
VRLANKVAIVTGGAKGIGRGVATVFAEEGCHVVIADVDEVSSEQTAADIQDAGGSAEVLQTDVRIPTDIERTIERTVSARGHLDVMVNNAGWHPPVTSIDETSLQLFESQLALNLTSTFLGSKYAVPHLRTTEGNIVTMASLVGIVGQDMAAAYAASKGGQVGLTKALAVELAPQRVRVNCICPAGVDTPLMWEWANTLPDPKAAARHADAIHPIGRMATPKEIGRAALFLASDDAAFVTGHALVVDGGATLDYSPAQPTL